MLQLEQIVIVTEVTLLLRLVVTYLASCKPSRYWVKITRNKKLSTLRSITIINLVTTYLIYVVNSTMVHFNQNEGCQNN